MTTFVLQNLNVNNKINTGSLFFTSAPTTTTVINALTYDTGGQITRNINLTDLNSTQTLTNKTVDSASNTVQVNGTNINSLIDQDVRTSASPAFMSALTVTSTDLARVSILSAAISNGNALEYSDGFNSSRIQFDQTVAGNKVAILPPVDGNILLDTNTATVTNKTINSASNTVQVNGTNINSLINQDVRTTASPTFAGLTITGSTTTLLDKEKHQSWATTSNTNFALTTITIGTTSNSCMILVSYCNTYVVSSSNGNATKSAIRRLTSRISNVSGTVTVFTMESTTNNDSGLDAIALTHVASGTNVLVKYAGIINDSHTVTGTTITFT